jgi:2-polyprenyl-3-methyl-5-hydroxy-6-metoxy-1,4-benzoquinol methylase
MNLMAEKDDRRQVSEPSGSIYETGEYLERNPTYHVEDSAWKARQILEMIRRNALEPRTVCEIGCGAGEILKQLQSSMPADTEFSGYEISPQAFALCNKRKNARLRFYRDDLIKADVAGFDLLLCIDVFEHVQDYIGFLRDLRAKARYKLFHIPLDMSAQWVMRGRPILQEREQGGHLHYFMKDTALAALRDAGYQVLDRSYTPGAIDQPRSVKAKMASLPRRLLVMLNQDFAIRLLGGYSLLVLTE